MMVVMTVSSGIWQAAIAAVRSTTTITTVTAGAGSGVLPARPGPSTHSV